MSLISVIRPYMFSLLLLVLVGVEVKTLLIPPHDVYLNPIIMVLSSLLICFIALWVDAKTFLIKKVDPKNDSKKTNSLLFFICSSVIGIILFDIFREIPIDAKVSDIIPLIQVMIKRFLSGEFVYAPVYDFGYNMFPNYMPFKWMPFILAELVHIDYRWIAYFVFLFSIVLYVKYLNSQKSLEYESSFKTILPFLLLIYIIIYERFSVGVTVELLDVGFYLFLAYSILSGSNLLRAVALSLCLMSRFSLVLWVPFFILIIFLTEKRRNAFIVSGITGVLILIFYVIPFMLKDFSAFKNGYDYYTVCAEGEWKGQFWQKPGEKPVQLFNGVGFASYYYDFIDGTIMAKISKIKLTQLISCIFTLVISYFLFQKLKEKINPKFFALLTLKFYLTFFYAFIQVPYIYLFFIPLFLSIYIIAYIPFKIDWNRE